jgi:hypothetical protein
MCGCGVASNTAAVGKPCWCFLRLLMKKLIKTAAEIATTPPTTPPATAPTSEEEPLELDEGDEVAVGEWVEAVGEEDTMAEEAGELIVVPGPASGVSEKETGERKTTK